MDLRAALERAMAHTRHLLVRPFDLTVWVCVGVIILAEEIVGQDFGPWYLLPDFDFSFFDGRDPAEEVARHIRDATGFLAEHFVIVASIGVFAAFLYLLAMLVGVWISSRGRLMFVRAVALGDHRIDVNWTATRGLAHSLFLFRIVVHLLTSAFFAGFFVAAASLIWVFGAETPSALLFLFFLMSPFILVSLLASGVLFLVHEVLRDFVVPLMFRFDVPCAAAWTIFFRIAKGNVTVICIYLLLRDLAFIAVHGAATLIGFMTLFIGFLPVVRQTILAPAYVLDRAASIYLIESIGPEYRIIDPMEAADDGPK